MFNSPRIWLWVGLASLGVPSSFASAAEALADAGSVELPDAYQEAYELRLVQSVLGSQQLQADAHPAGKKIERVVVVPLNLFTEGDPWPSWWAVVHAKTRDSIVSQELLFTAGQAWNPETIAETERNLRQNLFLSVARIQPCQGSRSDRVVALVVTKDLWSLRLNSDFSYVDSRFELIDLELAEFNLAGENQKLGTTFREDLGAYSAGLEFAEPRLAGSRIATAEKGSLIWTRSNSRLEGGTASVSLGQPLYSLSTPWGWSTSVSYSKDVYRLFSGGLPVPVDLVSTGEVVPYEFNRQRWDLQASGTRSFGLEVKNNFTAGWKGYTQHYGLPGDVRSPSAQGRQEFESTIQPRSEDAGMAFVSYHHYEARYLKVQDINSFALTEDFRLGLELQLEVRLAEPEFGFNSHFLEAVAGIGDTWALGDDLLTLSASGTTRYQNDVDPRTTWVNRDFGFHLHNVSPMWKGLRLHLQTSLDRREFDLNHSIDTLGGDSLLRGYPSAYFVAPNLWTGNVEIRSAPLEFHTVYLGWATFLDSGSAFATPSDFTLHASTGVGLRLLFPQFNRSVLRLDLGIPLETGPGVSPVSVSAGFDQTFN